MLDRNTFELRWNCLARILVNRPWAREPGGRPRPEPRRRRTARHLPLSYPNPFLLQDRTPPPESFDPATDAAGKGCTLKIPPQAEPCRGRGFIVPEYTPLHTSPTATAQPVMDVKIGLIHIGRVLIILLHQNLPAGIEI